MKRHETKILSLPTKELQGLLGLAVWLAALLVMTVAVMELLAVLRPPPVARPLSQSAVPNMLL
eukprot:4444946-Pyramimonas_sp.AAC.1